MTIRTRPVQVGDEAPGFTLCDQSGNRVSIADFRGKAVVLFFYPKDDTPGCTVESCTFRDHFDEFQALGAELIGISSDDEDSHRRFASRHGLRYKLLADHGGKVRTLYGVPKTFGLLAGRVTYVIDSDGFVRHVFRSQLNVRRHVTQALAALRRL